MRRVWLALAMALASGVFLAGCTAQLTQADRDLLNQALAAGKSAAQSEQRAEAAANRASEAARRAETAAAQAERSAEDAKKAFKMNLTK